MTDPADGPQRLLPPDVARSVAQHVIESDPVTARLPRDQRVPAESYVEDAIQSGALNGSEHAFLYVYEAFQRDDERIQAVRAHRELYDSQGPQAAPVADRLAGQALESAGWMNDRVRADVGPALQDFVGKTIQDTANDAHKVVIDWSRGKLDDHTPGIDAFDARVQAYQVNNVFAGLEDARLATGPRSGPLQGERGTPASQPANTAGHEVRGQG